MRRLKILWLAVLLTIAGYSLAQASLAAGAVPGSQPDPLVTKSYVDDYLDRRAAELQAQLNYVNSQLKDLEAKIAELRSRLAATRIRLTIGQRKAYVGAQEFDLPTPPFQAEGGTSMVPFRFIGEALGARIGWDGGRQEVTFSHAGRSIVLQIGSPVARVGGQEVPLAAPPRLVDGTTMVPLRLVGEQLGARVEWDEATRTITIWPKS